MVNETFEQLILNTKKNHQNYLNPIPVVMGLIHKGNKLVVVKNNHNLKHWQLVSGFIDPDESAEEAMIREAMEETGLKVKIDQIIGTFPSQKHIIKLVIVFKLKYLSGKLTAQDDIVEAKWVDVNENTKFRKGSLSEYIYKKYKNNEKQI